MPLYPKKNLLPPLTDSRWIIANPLKILSGYEAYLQSDVPAWDTSKVTIDVTVGETYYVQADIEGEFSVELWENGTVNLGSFARKDLQGRSFTARYTTWEVRIVRNAQATGYMKIKNFMVSKASYKQDFEPYDLGMKRDSFKKDIVYPGISGSSHVATAADIFAVKRDVRVGKSQINIATTGVFKVAIYEWADGVGRIGNPIYQKDTTYDSTGVYTYDFGGVLLKAGKNYWIGRYEDTGGASANRTLTAVIPNETYKHVTWLGGTSFTSLTLAYPTTYYYFYGLEFEADSLKKAPLLPERNLIPDFTDKRWGPDTKLSLGGTTMKVDADNPHRGTLTVGISAQSWMIQIPVKSGKTYTFQFGNITGLYRLLKGWTDSYNNVPIVGQDSKVLRITPDDSYNGYVTLRLTHGAAGDYRFEDLLMVEGDYSTVQTFTPYVQSKLKPASPVPKKNLYKSDDDYIAQIPPNNVHVEPDGWVVWDNPSYSHDRTPLVDVKANTFYTFSVEKYNPNELIRVEVTDENVVKFADTGNAVISSYTFYTGGRTKIRVKHQGGKTRKFMLCEGSDTDYKPYELGMKPAILYPKKNYFNINGGEIVNKSGTTTGRHYSAYAIDNPNRSLYYWLTPVKSGGRYTLSWQKPNLSMAIWEIDKDGIVNFDTGWKNTTYSLTLRSDTVYVMFVVRKLPDPSPTTYYDIIDSGLQFEEGSIATEFEKYNIGMKQL